MKANLTTICSSEAQGEIRAFLSKYFNDTFLSDSEINQIILAIDEAVANAIIHGNQSDVNKSISMDIELSDEHLIVEISNIGLFDDAVKNKDEKVSKELKDIIKEKQKGGLGLKLIYSIMDIVCFYTKDQQSYCRLVKMFK